MTRTIEEIKYSLANEERFTTYYEGLAFENAGKVTRNAERKDLKGVERFAKEIVANMKDLAKSKKEVKLLKEELKQAEIVASKNSNDVIDIFLQDWKEQAAKYYENLHNEYKTVSGFDYPVTEENLKGCMRGAYNDQRRYSDSKVNDIMAELSEMNEYEAREYKEKIKSSKVNNWIGSKNKGEVEIIRFNMKRLDSILDKEVVSKKKNLISRIEKVTGNIVDAQGLYIADNGSINGFVIGEEGKAEVETIYAGGYNIQILHYRVLVKSVK